MIFLMRNTNHDEHYTVHSEVIMPSEIVKLVHLENFHSSFKFPADIRVSRSKQTNDPYIYTASLNCFDYMGSSAGR
jgi:hypothetical protein